MPESLRWGCLFRHAEPLPEKGEEMGLSNVLYCHGGFLTYEHEAEPADTMVSMAAIASSAGFLEIGHSY